MSKGMEIDFSSTALTRREEVQPTILRKLEDKVTEHAKLVFLFDCSSSMNERVSRGYTDQYTWSVEIMAGIRMQYDAAVTKANAAKAELGPMWVMALSLEEANIVAGLSDDVNAAVLTCTADDEELKRRVVQKDLIGQLNVPVNWEKHDEMPPTRVELVQKLGKQEIHKRFNKFPKSRIAVIRFTHAPEVLFDDGKEDDVDTAMAKIVAAGGTDILAAIREAMEVCRRKPSPIGVHHLIVVSDGEDNTTALPNWVPAMKQSGVVLDYIHIGDRYVNESMQQACKALGGEMVVVNSEKDFEKRFVEAVNRPMLPAAQ